MMEGGVEEGKGVRVSVVFNDGTWERLKRMAQDTGRTEGEVIAAGINKTIFFEEERKNGSKVLVGPVDSWWRLKIPLREVTMP
jgi:hypothetical protein